MSQKPLILAVGILAGAVAVYFIPEAVTGPVAKHVEIAQESTETVTREAVPPPPAPTPVDQAVAIHPAAPVATSAWSKLAAKYGVEKTTLSSKITSNLASLIDQGIELANTAARESGSASIAEAASKEALRDAAGQLSLTEEQQKQASSVIQSAVEKRMAAVADLTSAMTSEPEQIMGMLLAGDSLARREITQAEYDQQTQPTRTMLQNLAGFVGGRPGSDVVAQFLGDPQTTAQLNAILNPDQRAQLAEMTAKLAQDIQAGQVSQNNSGLPFQPGRIPVMELDKLDLSVASVKQMADAAKLMMNAMKGLKDANTN